MGTSLFVERLVNGLEWEFYVQEKKKGFKNSSSFPFLNNLEVV